MSRKFWLAATAYFVPTFPLGYAWHLVTFHDRYVQLAMYRDDVIIPLGLTSMALQAVIFAWAYPRLCSTRRPDWVRGAAVFFGVMATLAWSFAVLPVAAKYRMASVGDFMVLETAFTVVQFAIVSPLVALAYRDRA